MEKIPVCEPLLGDGELKNVLDAVKTGWISGKGRYVAKFEDGFAKYCGAAHGITTTSGTTALHLAMLALGIGKGDEVIVPDFTMIAPANAVVYVGAKPVWVDAEARTWNIDPNKIDEKITEKTKAILAVHTYGHPADMDPIMKIARERGLLVIEDGAEAHGAEYKGKKVGCLGDAGCFSFYANKIITTGEGGMVVTNDDKVAEGARLFKDLYFDKERRYIHKRIGFNYRMTNVQAAIGVAQLERIDELVDKRRRTAHLYNSLLKGIKGITLPPEAEWSKNVYWMYTIMVGDGFGMDRDGLKEGLEKNGIDTRFTFSPMHRQPCFTEMGFPGSDMDFKVAEELSRNGLYLPSGPALSEDQISHVCGVIKKLGQAPSKG
jgi:perosamine synthetase